MQPVNAFVVHLDDRLKPLYRSPQDSLTEAVALAKAIKLQPVLAEVRTLVRPRASTYIGKGHAERLAELAALEEKAPLIIINSTLTPIQQRNLELATNCKVIDRTALILEIFSRRAVTSSGKLQVELALLTYQRSRLVRSWTHLERQRGGGAFLGGPGESQIELDRRILLDRVKQIKKALRYVERTRRMQRQNRDKTEAPVVALIGYTNAGKSTLFNALTGANVPTRDMLFATLDPTIRQCQLLGGRKIVLLDTVGFISQLPTELIEAFKSTLEEVAEADLLIHVHDCTSPKIAEEAQDVFDVLRTIGLTEEFIHTNTLHVLNKSDQAKIPADLPREQYHHQPMAISALVGSGLECLHERLETVFVSTETIITLQLSPIDTAARAWLYRNAIPANDNSESTFDANGHQQLSFHISNANFGRFEARWPQLAKT